MRSELLYLIYSGQLFLLAAVLIVSIAVGNMAGWLDNRAVARRIAAMAALLALVVGIAAAPPFPPVIAGVAVIFTAAYLFAGFHHVKRRRWLGSLAVVALVTGIAAEIPYHRRGMPSPRPARLFVIGDSLASGDFGEERPWPLVIESLTNIPVTNLSLASGDVAMAVQRQVVELPAPSPGDCVLIEVGGNDMLDGTDGGMFEANLDRLIVAARAAGVRRVVMLELPLLPGKWRYGAIQRRVAKKQGCTLVPKRILAKALTRRGNTSDGLHLTQRGHDELARLIVDWLGWNVSGRAGRPPSRGQS